MKGIERTAYPTAKDHGLKLRLQDGASENTSILWHCSENARNPLKECESERLKELAKRKQDKRTRRFTEVMKMGTGDELVRVGEAREMGGCTERRVAESPGRA